MPLAEREVHTAHRALAVWQFEPPAHTIARGSFLDVRTASIEVGALRLDCALAPHFFEGHEARTKVRKTLGGELCAPSGKSRELLQWLL